MRPTATRPFRRPLILALATLLAVPAAAKTSKEPIRLSWSGHSGPVFTVAFSPDGSKILSGSFDNTLKLWDAVAGKELATWSGHDDNVRAAAFSPDGTQALSAGSDGKIKRWSVQTGAELATWNPRAGAILAVAYAPNGKTAISGGDDKKIRLWDVASGRVLATWLGHSDGIAALAFSNDGKSAVSGSFDKTIKVWDVATGDATATFPNTAAVLAVALSPDGATLISGGEDRSVKFWDIRAKKPLSAWSFDQDKVRALAVSADGALAVSGGFDKVIKLWDMPGRRLLTSLPPVAEYVYAAAFSPDGRKIAFGVGDTVQLLDVPSAVRGLKPAAPQKLDAKATFTEPSGDGVLDADEKGALEVSVTNTGDLPALAALSFTFPRTPGFTGPGAVKPFKVGPKDTITKQLSVAAAHEIATGKIPIAVEIKEQNGFNAPPLSLEIPTRAFEAPKFVIEDVRLDAAKAKPGELLISLTIKNEGGLARSVVATLKGLGEGIASDGPTTFAFDRLEPGEPKTLAFRLRAGGSYDGAQPELSLGVTESRKKYGLAPQRLKLW